MQILPLHIVGQDRGHLGQGGGGEARVELVQLERRQLVQLGAGEQLQLVQLGDHAQLLQLEGGGVRGGQLVQLHHVYLEYSCQPELLPQQYLSSQKVL